MPRNGAVLLGDWLGKAEWVEFACSRCSRHGRQQVGTLIIRFGPETPLPEVLAAISADCPRRLVLSQALSDPCGVHAPQAGALFGGHK